MTLEVVVGVVGIVVFTLVVTAGILLLTSIDEAELGRVGGSSLRKP